MTTTDACRSLLVAIGCHVRVVARGAPGAGTASLMRYPAGGGMVLIG